MKPKRDPFFDVMGDIISSIPRPVEAHHITTQRVVEEAQKQGVTLTIEQAFKLLQRKVKSGLLKVDGKRVSSSGKSVTVWVAVKK